MKEVRIAHPAATSEQARKSRCSSPEGEGGIGAVALRLVGVMARVAGWRPGEVWAATPADIAAVLASEAGGAEWTAAAGREGDAKGESGAGTVVFGWFRYLKKKMKRKTQQ